MSYAFMTAIENTMKKENVLTENGAIGYRTSGSPLVDFNFRIGSYRGASESEIASDFAKAFDYNPVLAVKMMFFAGDMRGGMGERKVFKSCLHWLSDHEDFCNAVIDLIPEYTRWDCVVSLLGTACDEAAWRLIKRQLDSDQENMGKGQPISLLGKWLPSVNASSKSTNLLGRKMARRLGMRDSQYRRMLSKMRGYLKIVEKKMSSGQWSEIDYNIIPSKANVLYAGAFMRHDPSRRQKYLNALERNDGSAKINASVAFPYDIVSSYMKKYGKDKALEAMWKALPDFTKGENAGGTLCVVDGSGSMGCNIGNTKLTAHDVARSLGIYFSERLTGPFKDKFITFSSRPQFVDLSSKKSLWDKIWECDRHDECSNTNIESTFDLILQTAVQHNLKQEDLPRNVLVISDMEFDSCTEQPDLFGHGRFSSGMKTLFEHISNRFAKHGYAMPRMVFWNVNSRSKAVPLQENEAGVALVSGFSPAIASMVFSTELDPERILLEKLDSERYRPVEKAIAGLA